MCRLGLLLLGLFLFLGSCGEQKEIPLDTFKNYKGGVVVKKTKIEFRSFNDCYLLIRIVDKEDSTIYHLKNIRVVDYEYNLINLGDTIK